MFSIEVPTLKWPVGKGHNSQLIVSTDYNLLLKGEEQVEICFIAHHERIVMQPVVYISYIIAGSEVLNYLTSYAREVSFNTSLKSMI